MDQPLILASASPQRQKLLADLGFRFSVIPSRVNEEACTEPDPAARALLLAREKAQEVQERHRGEWIIAGDTLVVASTGERLEKPVDEADARRMIQLHSGQTSTVHSGLAVVRPDGAIFDGLSSSSVTFRTLSDKDINWWIESGLWRDRSGSFQIDGLGQLMIKRIDGDWTSIVGLPVFLLGQLLEQAGYPLYSSANVAGL
jgi:septum formation protein